MFESSRPDQYRTFLILYLKPYKAGGARQIRFVDFVFSSAPYPTGLLPRPVDGLNPGTDWLRSLS